MDYRFAISFRNFYIRIFSFLNERAECTVLLSKIREWILQSYAWLDRFSLTNINYTMGRDYSCVPVYTLTIWDRLCEKALSRSSSEHHTSFSPVPNVFNFFPLMLKSPIKITFLEITLSFKRSSFSSFKISVRHMCRALHQKINYLTVFGLYRIPYIFNTEGTLYYQRTSFQWWLLHIFYW